MTTAVACDRTAIIYALADPRTGEVRYVGKTVDLAARLRMHYWEARTGTTVRCRWVWKLLEAGLYPEVRVLEEVPEAGWQEAEKRWIASLRGEGVRLLNGTDGGDGGYFGPEVTARAAAKRRGHKCSPETRQRMSDAKSGVAKSPEHVQAVRLALAGRPNPCVVGEKNPAAVLTVEMVRQIRQLSAAGSSNRELAAQFGITPQNVWNVVTRKTWTHIPMSLSERR